MISHKRSASKLLQLFLLYFLSQGSGGYASRDGNGNIRCKERERLALLTFKRGLIDSLDVLSSWGSEDYKKECCKWKGIMCSNRTGHVTSLQLIVGEGEYGTFHTFHTLGGKLSPALLELRHLNLLDLSHNHFEDKEIPKFIGSFKKLKHLNLAWSDFSGVIGDQLGNLSNLETLDLGFNVGLEFKKLDWLPRLSSLTRLDMSWANLSDPQSMKEIMQLHSLKELYLTGCDIPQITSPLMGSFVNSSLKSLSDLNLLGTGITSQAFQWLFNVSANIVSLDLSINNIEGLVPEAFQNLIFLEYLDLSDNMFEGTIPMPLWNLSNLRALFLYSNNFSEPISTVLQELPGEIDLSLQVLDLSYNQITGSIPDLRALVSLRKLILNENKLQGLPVTSLERLSNLETFDVSYNSIEGTIHEAHLSNLHSLKVLNLSFNLFSLDIRSDWIPPFQLHSLKLARCEMGSRFPRWMLTQRSLSQLDLSSARIQDLVPDELWDLSPRFEFLNLSNNQISGGIRDLSSNFLGFPMIDLSSNNFSGPLPLIHPNTSTLQVSRNMFGGSISWLCRNTYDKLGMLDISDNQFSGEIPHCWRNMTSLYILNLANNNIQGNLPPNLEFPEQLETLHLRNNNFSGELPSTLRNCERLRMLDVGENKIQGAIPSWIGARLTSLVVLSLRQNEFYGTIPRNICHLTNIQILDFSRNRISGEIPHCFDNFTSMVHKEKTSESAFVRHVFGLSDGSSYEVDTYIDHALVQWKGLESEYRGSLSLLKLIDLSGNSLMGSIPQEISLLKGLISLNLSRNQLTGRIDPNISQMEMLESLDLSINRLSGEIPTGLGRLTFLSVLDLSNNSLSGKIPPGTQLEGFNASVYAGNSELCGNPLKLCPGDGPTSRHSITNNGENSNSSEEDGFVTQGFYISMAVGFITAFWGTIATLFLKISWRVAYFNFWSKIGDKLYFVQHKIKVKLEAIFE